MHITVSMHITNVVDVISMRVTITMHIMNIVHIIWMHVAIAMHTMNIVLLFFYECYYCYAYHHCCACD